jgi:Amt family ammonium transporter
MCFIQYVCRVPLRMSVEKMEVGDWAIHGEEPYTFAHYNRSLLPQTINNGDTRKHAEDEEKGSSDGSGVIMGTDPHAGRDLEIEQVGEKQAMGPGVKQD